MKLTANEIANLVKGEVVGDGSVAVTGLSSLKDASPSDLSLLNSPKYLKDLAETRAGIVLVPKGTSVAGRTAVIVQNPQEAISILLQLISKEKSEKPEPGIHPSAVVAKDASIGENVSIGPLTVVEAGAVIGKGSVIGAQCYIGKRTVIGSGAKIYPQVVIREEIVIGERVTIHPGTVIGADGFGYTTTADRVHHKVPQIGTVEIGDDVEIGVNVSIDRAAMGKTVIGRGTKIDNLVQIGHNVRVGEGCILISQVGISGSTRLGNFVTLAGQVGVSGHLTIGDGAIAAAQSGIPSDVAAGSIVFGSPARPIQNERKIQVIISKLPDIYSDFKKMKKIVLKQEPKDD